MALVFSISLLAGAQIALVSRYLFARQGSVEGRALRPAIADLIWTLAPGALLAALLAYSLIGS